MKKNLPLWILSIAASLFISTGLLAQEQVEVSVKVKKDGKVIKDTTYLYEDASEAKHAIKMMDVMSGDDEHMKEIHKDSAIWITEKEVDGDNVKIVKYKIKEGEESHGKHVIVMKGEDGNTFDVLVDEDFESGDDEVKVKVMKIMEEEGDGEDVEVIVIKKVEKDKDCDHDEDHDHDEDCDHDVDVKVVKKKVKK